MVLFPILGLYYSVVPKVTITEFLLMMYLVFAIIFDHKFVVEKNTILIIFLVILNYGIVMFANTVEDSTDLAGSTFRYLLYIISLVLLTKDKFDYLYAKKMIINVSLASSVYLIFQFFIAKIFDIYLPGGLPFFETTREDMRTYVQYAATYGYRPRSLFAEPAHFCQFVLVALVILIFDNDKKNRNKNMAIGIISLAIILSRSLLGVFVLAFVICMYLFDKAKERNKRSITNIILITPIALIVLCFVAFNTSVGMSILHRLGEKSIFEDSRLIGMSTFNSLMNKATWIYGNGLSYRQVYLNSYYSWVYSFGIIGFIVLLVYFWKIFKKGNKLSRYLLLTLLVLGSGSELFIGSYILLYMNFILGCNDGQNVNRSNVLQ